MAVPKIPIAQYQTPDKRLQMTQDKLFAALQAAFEAGDAFDTIRVSTLCQHAHVARQTYYRHYRGLTDIIEIKIARLINQLLQHSDRLLDSHDHAAAMTVDIMLADRPAIAMIFWGQADEQIVQYLVRDMHRVLNIRATSTPEAMLASELFARMIISFAHLVATHPQAQRNELITIYRQLVPDPGLILSLK
ncbi:hypothetical protein [Lacticaseibacillus sp. GG6-2]